MLGAIQGNQDQVFPGFEVKTGTMDYTLVNANPSVIPLTLYVTYAQVAATNWGYVKYGTTNLLSTRQYEGSASAYLSTGVDGINMVKKQISLINMNSCQAKVWLEKKTEPFPGYTIKTGSYNWTGSLPSNIIPLGAYIIIGGTQWTTFPAGVSFKDNLNTTWKYCDVPAQGSGSWEGDIDVVSLYNGDIEKLKQIKTFSVTGSQQPSGSARVTIWLEPKA